MANILYGVAGEGSGHASRARVIIEYLRRNGHTVKVITHGRAYENLKPDFDVEQIFGLSFAYKENKVQYLRTVFKNIFKTHEATKSIDKVLKLADAFKPQIIFSDFEPITAAVANLKRLPLISIDNQHLLTNAEIEYPQKYDQIARTAKTITKLMVMSAKAYLVTSFFQPKIKNRKTFLAPPILRREVIGLRTKTKDYVLVYFSSPYREIINTLKQINQKFVIYGFNQEKILKNLVFKKVSQKEFLVDLASCRGIIANAGFSLLTEALYLKKPYLALPVQKQFEQVLNAYYLEKLGYGKYWDELNKERIESFLFNLGYYQQRLRKCRSWDNQAIFAKVDHLIEKYAKSKRGKRKRWFWFF